MRIVNCRYAGGKPPRGSVYIGRAMGGACPLEASPLANPYIPRSRATKKCMHGVVVDDGVVLDRYARRLTSDLVQGFPALGVLRLLREYSRLACWCDERPAVLFGQDEQPPLVPCHGDVIWTVWLALERLGWSIEATDRRDRVITWDVERVVDSRDYDAYHAVWYRLYEEAFGEPMRWAQRIQDHRVLRKGAAA